MNTSKQVNAMILLLALLLLGIGAYTIWDPFRAEAETERTREKIVERAAHTYARNCRVCHGNNGEGRIGPALEPEARKRSGLDDLADPNKLKENQAIVKNTIACGRIGTVMPPWAQDQGGALTDEQVRQLVILITENPGGEAWKKVQEISAEDEHISPLPPVQEVLAGSSITGQNSSVCGQKPLATPTAAGATPAAVVPTGTPPAASTNITLVATDNRFDQTALAVPNNERVTLTLNNRGAALHNWHVTGVRDKCGQEVTTKLLTGGQQETITFTIDRPGTYDYLCDVHPVEMRGRITVAQP